MQKPQKSNKAPQRQSHNVGPVAGGEGFGHEARSRPRRHEQQWRGEDEMSSATAEQKQSKTLKFQRFITQQKSRSTRGSSDSRGSSASTGFWRFWPVQHCERFCRLTGLLGTTIPGRTGRSGPVLVTLVKSQVCEYYVYLLPYVQDKWQYQLSITCYLCYEVHWFCFWVGNYPLSVWLLKPSIIPFFPQV